MYFLNTDYLAFYGVPTNKPGWTNVKFGGTDTIDGVYETPSTFGFNMRDWLEPIDQYASVALIDLIGNLICRSPRHQGVLEGITGS